MCNVKDLVASMGEEAEYNQLTFQGTTTSLFPFNPSLVSGLGTQSSLKPIGSLCADIRGV